MSLALHEIIRKPRITEKAVHLHNVGNQYTFEVHRDANKVQVKEAVQALFKVDVLQVRTMNCMGKRRRTRMGIGFRPDWKKAIVTLAAGQQIEGL